QRRPRPCRHHHPHRHGGHATHRHQLRHARPHLSQRRIRLHLRRRRTPLRPRLHHRLGHADGLHSQSAHLHHSLQQAYAKHPSRSSLLGACRFLRRRVHSAQPSRRKNFRAHQRSHGRSHDHRRRRLFRLRHPLSDPASQSRSSPLHTPLLRS